MPMTPFSGVRISWLISRRNCWAGSTGALARSSIRFVAVRRVMAVSPTRQSLKTDG